MSKLKGKQVLVTGANGFIGSHLVEALVDAGAQVRAFVRYNSRNSWGWLEDLPADKLARLDIFAGDIRDPNGVLEAMGSCDVVFHLAALIGIPYSYHSPDSYVDTNVKGTLNVLQAARRIGSVRVLVTSTSEVYGTALQAPITEEHPRQGQSPYSATKIAADSMAESFFRSFDLPVTIVRPFNTYGPRQSARAIIPAIIIQLLSGASEIELGALHPTRDLVYVKDTAQGFIKIAESDSTIGQEVNIATGAEIAMGALAERIIEAAGVTCQIKEDPNRMRPSKSEVLRLLGSADKLEQLTGWKPGIPLERGLTQTIEWFRDAGNRAGYKANIYNV